ncbi:MAG: hypothetical protein JWM25_999 [Thermoleophilia bacterium]|nr:hypothetical protein [Thermoleophilia bacterium]MCZ4496416.1 hypothetical protein [Thermoleophilia bacterium]
MRIQTPADAIYALISRLPLLLLFAGICWVLFGGLAHLEMYSFGTEFFIGNDETSNLLPEIGGTSDEARLQAALDSGNVATMDSALTAYEARQAG